MILDVDAIPERAVAVRLIAETEALVAIGLIPLVCDARRIGVIAIGFAALPDRVGRLRFQSLGALGTLLVGVRERQQRERDEWLRQAESLYRKLMRRSADIVVGFEADGQLVFVSPSAREILGYEPAELLGTNVFALVHGDDEQKTAPELQAVPVGRIVSD